MAQNKPKRALANWLREERARRGWSVAEMARKLRQAADATAMPGIPHAHVLISYVSKWEWEHVGVSERYRLLYCAAFGIQPKDFGPPGSKRPTADNLAIVMFRTHPAGTGAGRGCQFNRFCTTPAKFLLQPAGVRQSARYACGRDLTRAINEVAGQAGTAVIVQRIVWPDQNVLRCNSQDV
jgi:transcriptional regulator with XRE-family HTH domain